MRTSFSPEVIEWDISYVECHVVHSGALTMRFSLAFLYLPRILLCFCSHMVVFIHFVS